MFYLIGGPPRMGKSTIAQKLLDEKRIPYVSTDGLTVMLKPAGQPSFYTPEKAERFYPYLDLFMSRMSSVGPQYTIEGDAFSPKHTNELSKKHNLKALFLIMKDIQVDNILKFEGHDDWSSRVSRAHLECLVERIKIACTMIENECKHYNIACFDLSEDYSTILQKAYNYLTSD